MMPSMMLKYEMPEPGEKIAHMIPPGAKLCHIQRQSGTLQL